MSKPRSARKFDRDLGQRMRAFRIEKDISQATLGEAVGVSFQQIQKYEKGMNRVAPATLTIIAQKLDVPVMALMAPPDELAPSAASVGLNFLTTPEGAKIAGAWPHITDSMRRVISAMVTGTAGAHLQAAE